MNQSKKKFDEKMIWLLVMIILPFTILMRLGDLLGFKDNSNIIFSAVGGTGGLSIGYLCYYFTNRKSRLIKIIATFCLLTISLLPIYLVNKNNPNDAIEVQDHWITQHLGSIEFDAPTKLQMQNISPRPYSNLINKELYSDKSKSTIFLLTEGLSDSLDIKKIFSSILESVTKWKNLKLNDLEMEILGTDDEEIASYLKYRINDKNHKGFGFVYIKKNTISSLWILPENQNFSVEYLNEFEAGIIPDY